MMLPIDQTDHAEAKRPDSTEPFRPGGILLLGYLRKLKRMKKKYFILFADSESLPARLEYFDSEKKWKNGQTAKRSIEVKSCFNINRRLDCKHKFVIGLYTNEDCFPIAFDSEEELIKWFITLLKIQLFDKVCEGEELKPIYEHVWQVTVQRKELGSRKNIVGPYRLCLNTSTRVLSLFKMPMTHPPEYFEFPVMTIRRCGHVNCQFFMEMGRGTVTGDGELWMELEDASVAQKVHGAVIEAMRNSAKEDNGPRPRTHSLPGNDQHRPSLPPSWNSQSPAPVIQPNPGVLRNRPDNVAPRSRTNSETVVVTPPDGRPASVFYEGCSTSPPAAVKSIPSSFSMDDFEAPLHPVNNHIRNRFSRTATPENSLPKESTILEEDRGDCYLFMTHGQTDPPPLASDYLSMTPRGNLSSSPSAHSVSSIGPTRSQSLSNPSIRGGYKNRVTPTPSGPPPIKPPLHPQSSYMEMASPVTTSSWASPPTVQDGYLPMYPPGSAPGSVGTRSGTHTRSSSFCEDPPDSYVPMAPQSVASSVTSRDGEGSYLEMQYRRSVPRDVHHIRGRLSPASGSSLASSFTSGTPPAGSVGRFQEYHLEKVASFLTPSEDDDSLSSLSCRQSRAYSVGSRPEMRSRKMTKISQVSHDPAAVAPPVSAVPSCGYSTAAHHSVANQDARVRAYSVGSRVAPGNNKLSTSNDGSSSSVSSSRHELEPVGNPIHQSPTHGGQMTQPDENQRKKSLSVPYLGSTSTPAGSDRTANMAYAGSNPTGTFFRTLLSQQQTAVKRENDLLEIDFARAAPNGLNISCDSLGVDQVDCAISYMGQFGSSDSVGRSSVASTNSSTTGTGTTGRPRSASNQSRPSFGSNRSIVGGKPKVDSFRGSREGRARLERLESVPQGRDQDYIEYGESRAQQQLNRGLESPDVTGPEFKSVAKTDNGHDQDSADEYVELAQPASNKSNPVRLSVSESDQGSGVISPGSDYMVMDSRQSRNRGISSLKTVLCQIAREPTNYMDMNYNNKHATLSHPGSISDEFTYLPMDYTPRSSRNPSRQSSQADLMALGTVSPSMRGSQTPRSDSARHSRTEESLQEHYMEMNFEHPADSTSHSLRSDKSVRSRIPSPYLLDGSQTDSEAQNTPTATASSSSKSGGKKPFLAGLFSRKSFSAGKSSVTSPTAAAPPDGGTLPRSSRSMPPSPFSSLKRPSKSSKTRRSTTTAGQICQSVSPVSPDVDLSSALMFHQRAQSMRSHSMGHSRSSLHSPLTPPSPSPSADFSMIQSQFSPPSPSVSLTSKPGSSQPISIALHRPSYTPRGSPHTGHTGIPALNLSRLADADEYVLPHTRYSTSPGRLMPMPTLSPLPEVLLNTMTQLKSEKTDSRTPTANSNDGYMNMDFGGATHHTAGQLIGKFTFEELPGSGDATPTLLPSTPSRNEASQPVRIPLKPIDDKENMVMVQPIVAETEVAVTSTSNGSASAVTPTNVMPIPAAKQRANSLEKIVCAFEKVIIGPKRHSSGDKPMKRSSGTLIHRSNSYQPSSNSRVIIAGNKPASLFPLLTDIPAGKIMSVSSKDNQNSKNSKLPTGQLANVTGSRTSSSSLVSLGEDSAASELQAVNWNSGSASFTPLVVKPSPTTSPSNSPSPSLLSRPTSVQSEREIHYAQLDLAPTTGQRSTPSEDSKEEVPKSPRIPRPASTSAVSDVPVTTYAQIDFKKSEGLKTIGHL